MSVKLRKRVNGDGTLPLLILDIYNNGKRKYEFLTHLKLKKASNPIDRETNKTNLELAKNIAVDRAHKLAATEYGIESELGKKTIIIDWMQAYIDRYTKKDVRILQGVLNRFIEFLTTEKRQGLTFGNLSALLIEDFIDYLDSHSKGEGSSSYYRRFKKMIKHAYRERLMQHNILDFVQKTTKGKAKKKDTLTIDEIQKLATTHTESDEVRRAALFSLVTGLRWIDINRVTWANINGKSMTISQSKTDEEIHINLNDTAIALIGKRGKSDDTIFNLPTPTGANKTLRAWIKRAGITKNITWHNLRHSFATNLVFLGTDIITTSSLLGHTSTKHTQRYIKAARELKERATDKLNFNL